MFRDLIGCFSSLGVFLQETDSIFFEKMPDDEKQPIKARNIANMVNSKITRVCQIQ